MFSLETSPQSSPPTKACGSRGAQATPEPTWSGRDDPQASDRRGSLLLFFNCDEIANLHPETKIKWREVLTWWVVFPRRWGEGLGGAGGGA